MSAAHVYVEIARFLASKEPEVLCITGRWGVGKTFAWNHHLRSSQAKREVALKTYAYVSLFGKRSLEDLKQSIFESSEPIGHVQGGKLEDASAALGRLARQATHFTAHLPRFGDAAKFAAQFYFLAVREQIVCIDDLERAGQGLDAKDVLGLVSFLKEQRRCKVVILLNHQELTDADRRVYDAQLEKVADTMLTFEPTADEAAAIGVAKDTSFGDALARHSATLGVTNIRVIKRIERFVRRLEPVLAGFDRPVFDQAIQTAALFGWSVYQPDAAPPLAFLKNYNQLTDYLAREKNGADPNAKWRSLLNDYGYSLTDEFDLHIASALERGYVDEPRLLEAASALQASKRAADRDNSFEEAWDMYHGSFDANQDVVLDALYESFRRSVDQISPTNLSGTIATFKDLGRPEQARELLDLYMERRKDHTGLFDLDHYAFAGHVTDPDVVAAFQARHTECGDRRNPEEVFTHFAVGEGGGTDDLAKIAELTADDFVRIFKARSERPLKKAVTAALKFRDVVNPTEQMRAITANATRALEQIAAESPLNTRRVRVYGVVLSQAPRDDEKRKKASPKRARRQADKPSARSG